MTSLNTQAGWNGARVARTLRVIGVIDRMGIPLSPLMVVRLLPWLFLTLLVCELVVLGYIGCAAAPQLASAFPELASLPGSDGTYFLFAFASLPAIADVLARCARFAASTRLETDPLVKCLPTLGVTTRDAFRTWIIVPFACRFLVVWSPLAIVASVSQNPTVIRLCIVLLSIGLLTYAILAFKQLCLLAYLPRPSCPGWCLSISLVGAGAALGVLSGSTLRSVGSAIGSSPLNFDEPTENAIPLGPVLAIVASAWVTTIVLILSAATLAVIIKRIRHHLTAAPQIYTDDYNRGARTGLLSDNAFRQYMNRVLYPVVGESWLRITWTRSYTLVAVFSLSAAATLGASNDRLTQSLPIFIVIPTLITPIIEHFRSIEPRYQLFRYRYHVELQRDSAVRLVLKVLIVSLAALSPIVVASQFLLSVAGVPTAAALSLLVAFISVGFFYANRPLGKGSVVTLTVVLQLAVAYALAFIFLGSKLVGYVALTMGFILALFIGRCALMRMVRV